MYVFTLCPGFTFSYIIHCCWSTLTSSTSHGIHIYMLMEYIYTYVYLYVCMYVHVYNYMIMYYLTSPAYGGRFCEVDQNGCSEIECFRGVVCFDVPAPDVGAVCGPCPDGFTGDGEKCNGKHTHF